VLTKVFDFVVDKAENEEPAYVVEPHMPMSSRDKGKELC
jgi:hypothetical protein